MNHTASALLAGLALVLPSVSASAQNASDELLVLGLRSADGSLTTILADDSGIRKVGSGIAVPRAKGWWKLDLLTRKQNSFEESILFAHDTKKPTKEPPFQFDESCESSTQERLLFVGPDHYSKEVTSRGSCEGAAHPWSYAQLATVAYDTGPASASLAIDAVLGQTVLDAWKKVADKAHGGTKKREKACLDEARPEEWSLVRQRGQWSLRGELNYLSEACRGKHEYFTVDVALPAKNTGPDALPQAWNKLATMHPGLLDFVSSPSGRHSLIVTGKALEWRQGDKTIGRLDEVDGAVVMAQWALGQNATRWRDDVQKLFAEEQEAEQAR